jgi:DNA-binding response OmpR family regulator
VPQILIVDNDEYVLLSLERVLQDQGYATAVAVNYEQTLMLLSDCSFDLLILDDHLSDRDSIQVVGNLQCSGLLPPFGVVTYHRRPSSGEQSCLRNLGVRKFISKLAHDELTQTVRAILGPQVWLILAWVHGATASRR